MRIGENYIYALRLARGGVLLIDAGPDVMGAWGEAQGRASSRGFAVDEVSVVLVTHAHIDHAGLAARWALAGARILAGAADVPALVAGAAWNESRTQLRIEVLRRHGASEEVLLVHEAVAARRGFAWEPCPPESVHAVTDGTTFALEGGQTLRVIVAPGHTPGNLVAVVEETGDLYAGDTLLPDTIPTPGLHFLQTGDDAEGSRWPSLPPFLRSVAMLRALGARRLLPGHGQPGGDPAPLIARFEAHHARRAARLRALLAERPDSAYGLATRMFPHVGPLHIAQAMTEAIGHLDAMIESGEAVREDDDGEIERYRLVVR
jgi:glyoxylase-like metal-dependent hydrolase (beta-lactamase superfamily II)